MKDSEKKTILGGMGEKYVANWMAKEGRVVEQSLFYFDPEKDLMADGQTVEVKTMVPFVKALAFGVRESQLRKLREVDRIFFINIPAPSYTCKYDGWLMEVCPKTFKYKIFVTADGRRMVRIPMEQKAVTPIHKIDDKILKEMIKYSTSGF